MATPVTIPVRFGTRRFGKVVGGVLDSDGLTYPQPGGTENWQRGMTILVAPPGTDPGVEAYGFKTNAMLSGGSQQLYGENVFGWIFCDTLNGARWLIQADLVGATADFASTLSITFDVVRFGLFDGNGAQAPEEQTRTLASWGQSTPDITEYGDCTHTVDGADLHLVSAKTDGSAAVLMASIDTSGLTYPYMPPLQRWAIGYIGVTCTAVEGAKPTLALSVLRDRATTIGTRTEGSIEGSLVAGTLCDDVNCTYSSGEETFSEAVSDHIVALFYDDDVLTEMTATAEIAGHNTVDDPTATETGWEQTSEGEVTITWTLACNGRSVSWEYLYRDSIVSELGCATKASSWTSTVFESFNGEEETEVTEHTSEQCFLKHTDASFGLFSLAINSACRSIGDMWEDNYSFADDRYLSWGFIRYAYNVVGLYAEADAVPIYGDALTPAAVITATSLNDGEYGAFNARTGQGVAGQVAPVGYV